MFFVFFFFDAGRSVGSGPSILAGALEGNQMEANCGVPGGEGVCGVPRPHEVAGCLGGAGRDIGGVAGTLRGLSGLPAIDTRVVQQTRPPGGLQGASPEPARGPGPKG